MDEIDTLLERHRSLVDAVARRSFPSQSTDPDLLQCGMIGLWQAAQRWDHIRPFPPFARACIRNAMRNYLRQKNRWGAAVDPEELPPMAAPDREEATLDRLDITARIAAAWPSGPERSALLALASGVPKARLAQDLGLTGAQLTRLLKRAWKRLA